MRARARTWDQNDCVLEVTNLDPEGDKINFKPGEIIEGETSGARYSYSDFVGEQTKSDYYSDNDNIQVEADKVVDTDEYNQFLDPNADYFDPDNPFDD